jgi:hypothetical protein
MVFIRYRVVQPLCRRKAAQTAYFAVVDVTAQRAVSVAHAGLDLSRQAPPRWSMVGAS